MLILDYNFTIYVQIFVYVQIKSDFAIITFMLRTILTSAENAVFMMSSNFLGKFKIYMSDQNTALVGVRNTKSKYTSIYHGITYKMDVVQVGFVATLSLEILQYLYSKSYQRHWWTQHSPSNCLSTMQFHVNFDLHRK